MRCFFEELKIYCAIDQLKPSLKSKRNIFVLLFEEHVSRKCASGEDPQRAFTLLITLCL